MAKTTLRDVINQIVERAWEAGAQAALNHHGISAPDALRRVRSNRDPVWRTTREDSIRRQQRLAREDIALTLETLALEAQKQLRLRDQALKADVDLARSIGLEF